MGRWIKCVSLKINWSNSNGATAKKNNKKCNFWSRLRGLKGFSEKKREKNFKSAVTPLELLQLIFKDTHLIQRPD